MFPNAKFIYLMRLSLIHIFITIAAFISPNNDIREMAADIIGQDDFLEVYVSTPLEECERRDVKGRCV